MKRCAVRDRTVILLMRLPIPVALTFPVILDKSTAVLNDADFEKITPRGAEEPGLDHPI